SVFGVACDDSENSGSVESKLSKLVKSVEVLERKTLTTISDGHFQNPVFSTDSKRIYFTSSNYNGIYYYDLDEKKLYTLNNESGSGYHFAISADGRKVYYRAEAPAVKRRRRFMLFEQEVTSGKSKKLLEKSVRNVSTPRLIKNNILIYSIDDKLKLLNLDRVKEESNFRLDVSYFSIQKNQLNIHQPGNESYNISFDGRSLLWPEWAHTGERMIVYVSGMGLQLIDPLKKDSRPLGDFRAAKWSPYENMIVYMRDVDDGERILESDIFTFNLLDNKSINLTQTPDVIEMYPDWSPGGKMIAYHTDKGNIELLELNIKLAGE
ncbi:MAG: PD40 domain-containing protein, partial [Calditrichia bacterium]|nr:PD40 domain-containing protein [Calditrichia bacterium]